MIQADTVSGFTFDLDGGAVCLDFANTRDSSGEHLGDYADLVAFAEQSTLLTPDDASWLREEAGRDGVGAEGVLLRAHRLRAAVFGMFAAVARGEAPAQRDVESLNLELSLSLAHARVTAGEGGYRWGWAGRTIDAPLWGIVRSAADVLTSDEQRRKVRQCGGTGCAWLFLDTSKNRTRQWCSMRSCGNREKARRHYERTRRARATTA